MDPRVKQIDADEREVAWRRHRFLDQADEVAVAAQLRHTELLGMVDFGQQHQRARLIVYELVDKALDAIDDEVVAEVHHERLVAEKVARDRDRVGKSERRVLTQIRDGQPEL